MKVTLLFETIRVIDDALIDGEREERSEAEDAQVRKAISHWIGHDEYVTIEIDTITKTARVVPIKEDKDEVTVTYFIDYNEDLLSPMSGDCDLVAIYEKLMIQNEIYIFAYKSELAMYKDIVNICGIEIPKDGIADYEHVDRVEMKQKIINAHFNK